MQEYDRRAGYVSLKAEPQPPLFSSTLTGLVRHTPVWPQTIVVVQCREGCKTASGNGGLRGNALLDYLQLKQCSACALTVIAGKVVWGGCASHFNLYTFCRRHISVQPVYQEDVGLYSIPSMSAGAADCSTPLQPIKGLLRTTDWPIKLVYERAVMLATVFVMLTFFSHSHKLWQWTGGWQLCEATSMWRRRRPRQ